MAHGPVGLQYVVGSNGQWCDARDHHGAGGDAGGDAQRGARGRAGLPTGIECCPQSGDGHHGQPQAEADEGGAIGDHIGQIGLVADGQRDRDGANGRDEVADDGCRRPTSEASAHRQMPEAGHQHGEQRREGAGQEAAAKSAFVHQLFIGSRRGVREPIAEM